MEVPSRRVVSHTTLGSIFPEGAQDRGHGVGIVSVVRPRGSIENADDNRKKLAINKDPHSLECG